MNLAKLRITFKPSTGSEDGEDFQDVFANGQFVGKLAWWTGAAAGWHFESKSEVLTEVCPLDNGLDGDDQAALIPVSEVKQRCAILLRGPSSPLKGQLIVDQVSNTVPDVSKPISRIIRENFGGKRCVFDTLAEVHHPIHGLMRLDRDKLGTVTTYYIRWGIDLNDHGLAKGGAQPYKTAKAAIEAWKAYV